ARFGGGRILQHAADQYAVLPLRVFEQRLHVDAQPASLPFAPPHDLFGHAFGEVAGNGAAEAEADFVDADDVTAHVDERAARIAPVNRRVMADPADERADVLAVEPETGERTEEPRHDHLGIADDPERDGLRQ